MSRSVDPRQPQQGLMSPTWGSRAGMRTSAIAGSIATVILLLLGLLLAADHRRGGTLLIILGAAGVVFWLVMIPLARRRAKI
jgi:Zn-dependent membrane protease YugP